MAPPALGRVSIGTFRTKEEAEAALRKALVDHERGIDLAPRQTTVAQVAERFFKAVKADLAPATYSRYQEIWSMHVAPTLGSMLIGDVKPAHVSELYGKLRNDPISYRQRAKDPETGQWLKRDRVGKPLGANSVLRIHRLLHRIFGWAERMNLVARNVIRSTEAPKATASPARALTVDQVVTVLKASEGTRLHGFLTVAAMTGMRRGEIGALTWDAVDLRAATAIVRQAIGEDRRGATFVKATKSGRARIVPLNAAVIVALRAQRAAQNQDRLLSHGTYQENGFVFADEVGGMLDLDRISKAFARLASQVGIKARGVSLHSLRHCAATMALHAGTDVRTVAALLGHASASTTLNVYGHVVAGAQERAVNAIGDAYNEAQARAIGGENGRP